MVRKVHKGWRAFKASKVIPDRKVRKVYRVIQARRAIPVPKDRKEFRATPARLVHKERREILVPKVHKDRKVNKDSKAPPAIHTGR